MSYAAHRQPALLRLTSAPPLMLATFYGRSTLVALLLEHDAVADKLATGGLCAQAHALQIAEAQADQDVCFCVPSLKHRCAPETGSIALQVRST